MTNKKTLKKYSTRSQARSLIFGGLLFVIIIVSAIFVSMRGGSFFELRQRAFDATPKKILPTFDHENQSHAEKEMQLQQSGSNKKIDPRDESKVVEYMKNKEQSTGDSVRINSPNILPYTQTTTPPQNTYYVQPILFVASDFAVRQEEIDAINATFQIIRRWYSGALEQNLSGFTFRVADTTVFRAPRVFSYYKCPQHEANCSTSDGLWNNVQSELQSAGFSLWTTGASFVIFIKGAGGWAGSNCGPVCVPNWPSPGPAAHYGVAMLGDWVLDAISGIVNPDCFIQLGTACYLNPQRGAIGHELGHTFGLAHANDRRGSIMYDWWNFPYTALASEVNNDEKRLLQTDSSFFSTQPCLPSALVNTTQMPTTVRTRTSFTTSFGITNFGFCRWNPSETSLTIVLENVWGIRQKQLGTLTYPAQQYVFDLPLTAPALKSSVTSKQYMSTWQLRNTRSLIGPQMGGSITVTR